MKNDSWNPDQYEKFKKERSQPFYDLVDLLEKVDSPNTIDLGCGTGEMTRYFHEKIQAQSTLGLDSSEAMLKKAEAQKTKGLHFQKKRMEEFKDESEYDILISNAALHWCENHKELISQFRRALKANGQLVIQMPVNHDYPTHQVAYQLARSSKWSQFFRGKTLENSAQILKPEEYAKLLYELGFANQKVFTRVYAHILPSRDDVVEWVQGSLLTQYQGLLAPDQFQQFLIEYKSELLLQLPDEKPFFYPFKRLFLWGKLGAS
ncbi:MAG: trans-aconitate 2-methyltransferase [Oligoflexia bacterium]|nr:MAG: trans-aconitate 2-methyltransferase [Oligoflexia bacterium]